MLKKLTISEKFVKLKRELLIIIKINILLLQNLTKITLLKNSNKKFTSNNSKYLIIENEFKKLQMIEHNFT